MLPKDLIKKLRRIEILTARAANAQLAGAYHSVFKGTGISFSEVRAYQPGDDVRLIDWNVTARMDEAYVKVFVEEREMTVMLLVDASRSMAFGSREQEKREVAAEVAALLAFSAIKNNDRVGLIIFTDHVERFVPPKKGKKHVLRVITDILTFEPTSSGTDVRAALDFLGRVTRRGSVAFLVSDFQAGAFDASLRVAVRRHDVVPVQLTDPLEEALPNVGLLLCRDPETGALVELDTGSRAERARYAQMARRRRDGLDHVFRRLRLDTIRVGTLAKKSDPDGHYIKPLVAFFRARSMRMRHG